MWKKVIAAAIFIAGMYIVSYVDDIPNIEPMAKSIVQAALSVCLGIMCMFMAFGKDH